MKIIDLHKENNHFWHGSETKMRIFSRRQNSPTSLSLIVTMPKSRNDNFYLVKVQFFKDSRHEKWSQIAMSKSCHGPELKVSEEQVWEKWVEKQK